MVTSYTVKLNCMSSMIPQQCEVQMLLYWNPLCTYSVGGCEAWTAPLAKAELSTFIILKRFNAE